jgi:hypothetical protein
MRHGLVNQYSRRNHSFSEDFVYSFVAGSRSYSINQDIIEGQFSSNNQIEEIYSITLPLRLRCYCHSNTS